MGKHAPSFAIQILSQRVWEPTAGKRTASVATYQPTEQGKGRRKKGVYGVDEDGAEETIDGIVRDLRDLDLCAVEEAWEVSTEQIGADFPGEFPPGLIDCQTSTHGKRSRNLTSGSACTLT